MIQQILIIFAAAALASHASAQKSDLKPTLRKQIRKDNISYTKCRKKVLDNLKSKKEDAKDLQAELQTCNAQFPNAAVFIACKTQVLKNFKKNPKGAKDKLAACREIQTASTYQPDNPVPFFKAGNRAFYAGIDLAKDMPPDAAQNLPAYDCEPLEQTLKRAEDAEYLLFGNTPRLFKPFATLKEEKLRAALKGKKEKGADPFLAVRDFGRLYEISGRPPIVLFPLSNCYFAAELGDYFIDHKVYFLLDYQGKELSPYFGVSFYAPKQRTFTVRDIERLLVDRLGPGYKAFDIRKKTARFISKQKPTEFDLEGDPKNLCGERDKNNLVALIRRDPYRPDYPSAMLVVNVGNSCEFGDKLARRLLGK
jgi:hypothetical protein